MIYNHLDFIWCLISQSYIKFSDNYYEHFIISILREDANNGKNIE